MIYPHSFHGVHRDDKLRYLVSYLCVFVGFGRRIKVFLSFLDIIFQINISNCNSLFPSPLAMFFIATCVVRDMIIEPVMFRDLTLKSEVDMST